MKDSQSVTTKNEEMSVREAVNSLRSLGYQVGLNWGWTVKVKGPKANGEALALIEHLKVHKKEALDLLFSEYLHHVIDIFDGKATGIHRADCQDLDCPGCYHLPQIPRLETERLF